MKKLKISKDLLIELYIKKDLSQSKIGELLNIGSTTVGRYLKKYNITKEYIRYQDLKGLKFFSLLVIGTSNKGCGKDKWWKCVCDCGLEVQVKASKLKNGTNKSCGCKKGVYLSESNFKGYKDISGTYFNQLKKGSYSRGHRFDLTKEDIWNVYLSQGRICAFTGEDLVFERRYSKKQTASVDRIDSSLGYELNNIQIIHKHINEMKYTFDKDYLISMFKLVASNKSINKSIDYYEINKRFWSRILSNAKQRNIEVRVSPVEVMELFCSNGGVCNLTGLKIKMSRSETFNSKEQTASLDRIDSSLGYILGNLQWVHKDINRMKNRFDQDYFIQMCKKTAIFTGKEESYEGLGYE